MHPMPGAIGDDRERGAIDTTFVSSAPGLSARQASGRCSNLLRRLQAACDRRLRASAGTRVAAMCSISPSKIFRSTSWCWCRPRCLIPIAILLYAFLAGGVLQSMIVPLILASIVYIVIAGLFVAAVTGYMAGLIGSSNSPVSGMAILTVVGVSLLLLLIAKADPATTPALVAYALFVTAIVLNVATISNDNLQDLKTGQIVGATPWKQQVALVVGVIFGAIDHPSGPGRAQCGLRVRRQGPRRARKPC